MSKNAIRILSVVAGALLIIAGAYCLFHQEVAVLSAGFILGLLLLTSGIARRHLIGSNVAVPAV